MTAKNTIQSRLEGLELGADAYLDKPFSTNLLMAQISNLISNRDNIRKFYFNSPIANMKSMAYTKADENLIGAVLSTRGPGWTDRWCICCTSKCIAE